MVGEPVTLDSEQARALARRSAEARRRLSLEEIERLLPALDSPAHIRANYELVQRWAVAGLLPPGTAQAVVKAADGALKLYEAALDHGLVSKLEKRVVQLEQELAAARASVGRRAP